MLTFWSMDHKIFVHYLYSSSNIALSSMLATLYSITYEHVHIHVHITCTCKLCSTWLVHLSRGPRGPYSACVQPTGKPWIAPIHGMYTADYLSHRSTCLTCPTCRLVWLPLYVVRTPNVFRYTLWSTYSVGFFCQILIYITTQDPANPFFEISMVNTKILLITNQFPVTNQTNSCMWTRHVKF